MMEVDTMADTPRGIDRGTGTLTAEASRLFRVYKNHQFDAFQEGVYGQSRDERYVTRRLYSEIWRIPYTRGVDYFGGKYY